MVSDLAVFYRYKGNGFLSILQYLAVYFAFFMGKFLCFKKKQYFCTPES